MNHADKAALEIELEQLSARLGRRRQTLQDRRILRQAGLGASRTSDHLIATALPAVATAICHYLDALGNGGRGKTHASVARLRVLPPDLLALAALVGCLNGIGAERPIATLAEATGELVEAEAWSLALRAASPELHGRIDTRVRQRHGHPRYRAKAARAAARRAGFAWTGWSRAMRARVGETLVNAVLHACPGMFETYTAQDTLFLGLTAEASETMTRRGGLFARPAHYPMIVPPRPWTNFDTGAYLTPEAARQVKLVRLRDRRQRQAMRTRLRQPGRERLFAAVNAIQATAWRVNERILELVDTCHRGGLLAQGSTLPGPRLAAPERPAAWADMGPAQRKAWRAEAARRHAHNRAIDSARIVVAQDLATAQLMIDCGNRFWMPQSLDFRGRAYPVPAFNPQRGDHVRGMLEFADGVPLGPAGLFWLAVHLANAGDFDKISKASFDDRVAWVGRHLDRIVATAEDPIGTIRWWSAADSPFQFVAACQDYARAITAADPAAHVSHLPVALDGSCSGLQHYAASLRDGMGAALVNLLPAERPTDIYGQVARIVADRVERDATAGDAQAREWQAFGVTRATVKRSVMTFAYSSEEFGFRRQLMADTMKPLADRVTAGDLPAHPFTDGGWPAAGYLARLLWQTVNDAVAGAGTGMAWFKQVAGLLASEGHGLHWQSAIGLPIAHDYRKWDERRIKLHFLDRSVPVAAATSHDRITGGQVHVRVMALLRTEATDVLDRAKQKSAIAPNVIHSMDASHLMLAVLAAAGEGIADFALIHDSFATHAARSGKWVVTVRKALFDLYETFDPYAVVHHAASAVLSPEARGKLPPPPARGSLDLRNILRADYAFA